MSSPEMLPRGWRRTRRQQLLQEHVESAATTCCLMYSQHCSLARYDINHLVIINLFRLGSVRLQDEFAPRRSWWHSLPGPCSPTTQVTLRAVATIPHLHSLQQGTQLQGGGGGGGDVTKAQQAHFTWISFTQQHTWACKLSSIDHSIEIMLAAATTNILPITHTDGTIWGQSQCLHIWKKCEIALVSSEFFFLLLGQLILLFRQVGAA